MIFQTEGGTIRGKGFLNVEPLPPQVQVKGPGVGGGEIRDLKDKTLIKTDLFTKGF